MQTRLKMLCSALSLVGCVKCAHRVELQHGRIAFLNAVPKTQTLTQTQRASFAVQSSKSGLLPRKELLKTTDYYEIDSIVAAKAIDTAELAVKTWQAEATDFLRPPEVFGLLKAMEGLQDVQAHAIGGYPQAERCRLLFSRPEMELGVILGAMASKVPGKSKSSNNEGGGDGAEWEEGENILAGVNFDKERDDLLQDHLAVLDVAGNFIFDPATHRDFLGSVLGTGIDRSRIGDILLDGERGCQIVIDPSVGEALTTYMTSVRTVPVECAIKPISELVYREPVAKTITSVETSMRLDAVASGGMRLSRSKLSDMVKAGDVLVNWKQAKSPSVNVAEGDIITVRGKGRVEINAVAVTAKGKYRVDMTSFK